jgi:hypothetical protein
LIAEPEPPSKERCKGGRVKSPGSRRVAVTATRARSGGKNGRRSKSSLFPIVAALSFNLLRWDEGQFWEISQKPRVGK